MKLKRNKTLRVLCVCCREGVKLTDESNTTSKKTNCVVRVLDDVGQATLVPRFSITSTNISADSGHGELAMTCRHTHARWACRSLIVRMRLIMVRRSILTIERPFHKIKRSILTVERPIHDRSSQSSDRSSQSFDDPHNRAIDLQNRSHHSYACADGTVASCCSNDRQRSARLFISSCTATGTGSMGD